MTRPRDSESKPQALPPRRPKTTKKRPTEPPPEPQSRLPIIIAGIVAGAMILLAIFLVVISPKEIESRADLLAKTPTATKTNPDGTYNAVVIGREGSYVTVEVDATIGKLTEKIAVQPIDLPRWLNVQPGLKLKVRTVEGPGRIVTYRGDRLIDWETATRPQPGTAGPLTLSDDGRTRKVYEPGGYDVVPVDLDQTLPPVDPNVQAAYGQALGALNTASEMKTEDGPPEQVSTPLLLAMCWPERDDYLKAANLPDELYRVFRRVNFDTRVKAASWLRARPEVSPVDYTPGVLAHFLDEKPNTATGPSILKELSDFLESLPHDDLVALVLCETSQQIPLTWRHLLEGQIGAPIPEGGWLRRLLVDERAKPFFERFPDLKFAANVE